MRTANLDFQRSPFWIHWVVFVQIASGHARFVVASSGRLGSTRSVAVNVAGKPTTNEVVARQDGNWLQGRNSVQRKEGKTAWHYSSTPEKRHGGTSSILRSKGPRVGQDSLERNGTPRRECAEA